MLQSVGSQRVGHDWVTEQQQQKFEKRKVSVVATQRDWGRQEGECSGADAGEQGGLPPTAKPRGHT